MKEDRPVFSIIVPTRNRPVQLRDLCLKALAGLDYPRDKYEVIVVHDGDDGGTEPPESHSAPVNIRFITQKHAGPAVARNTGAQAAKGRFLAFTDDDCAPAPNWLRRLESLFKTDCDCAVGGKTINLLTQNPYSTASQMLIDYLYGYFLAGGSDHLFFASNNLAMPAEQFRRIGGFGEAFGLGGEDRELCDRWRNAGHKLIYDPQVIVYHAHDLTFRTFVRQHFKYGRGASRYRHVALKCSGKTVSIESPSFYLNLLRHPCSQIGNKRTLPLVFLLLISQLINAAGFFWEKLNARPVRKNANRNSLDRSS